jgi:hypothetical protein
MKKGDILVSGWGYSMRLYDFYEVVDFTVSGKSVRLRKMGGKLLTGGTPWQEPIIPDLKAERGPVFTKKIINNKYVKITSCQFAYIDSVWDGKKIFYQNTMD